MISYNLPKAKKIAHDIRRQRRAEEFQPLDEVIMKQIPGTDIQTIEAERQLIRDKYATIQTNIDAAENSEELSAVVNAFKEAT